MIIFNILKMVMKQGPDIQRRNKARARNMLIMQNAFTNDQAEDEADEILQNFCMYYQMTLKLELQIRK